MVVCLLIICAGRNKIGEVAIAFIFSALIRIVWFVPGPNVED